MKKAGSSPAFFFALSFCPVLFRMELAGLD
jgi:hypothetical protein